MNKGRKLITAEKKFSFWLSFAAAMHALVLCVAFYFQIWEAGRHARVKIVSVSLVSLPGSGGSSEFSSNQVSTETAPSSSSPADVSGNVSKQIPEETLKPEVVEKQPDISKALERLKQNVEKKTAVSPQPNAGSLNKALDRLKEKVRTDGVQSGAGGANPSPGGRSSAGKGYGGGGTADPYKVEIAAIIQRNWEFSKLMLKNSYGMAVYVRINITTDGTIRQILFDRRAPSEYLNISVKKALDKSSPLPAPPGGDEWIGFVFTPEGIEK